MCVCIYIYIWQAHMHALYTMTVNHFVVKEDLICALYISMHKIHQGIHICKYVYTVNQLDLPQGHTHLSISSNSFSREVCLSN